MGASLVVIGRFQVFPTGEGSSTLRTIPCSEMLSQLGYTHRPIAVAVLARIELRTLRLSFSEWIVAGLSSSRAVDPSVLAQRLQREGAIVTAVGSSVARACELAEHRAARGDRIVVFGSFLTVGPALEWLQREAN
jgi:hypothetical protein